MTSDAIRVALVGAGYFARFHLGAWRRMDGVQLVAVCDRDPATHAHVTDSGEAMPVFAEMGAMLDAEQPDLVDIATPPETHLALVGEAAARGLAVVCQKPLAPTRDEAVRLVGVAPQAAPSWPPSGTPLGM